MAVRESGREENVLFKEFSVVEFYIFCEVPHQAVAALAGVVIVLVLLALALVVHLFLFHVYLSKCRACA